jgi:Winged helix DNA-binding domain
VAARVLSNRELNRAVLARQMLLERETLQAKDAVAKLVGLQAQAAAPPFVGLWTRLAGFRREELARLIERHEVVRATMMRHTLHLVRADDYARFRSVVQPALTRSFRGITRKRLEGLDLEPVLRAARKRLKQGPATFAEFRELAEQLEPERDVSALTYAVRTFLPLIQVPAGGRWAYSNAAPYTAAEELLGKRLRDSEDPRELVLRYLAAFGPARVADVQTWSGLSGLRAVVEDLGPDLRLFQDESGGELVDLPDAPRPPADTPAPARLLPEYDNLLLAYADRTRVIADEHRRAVFLSVGRVRGTFLVDGFVRGTWSVQSAKKGRATLVLEPFEKLSKRDSAALEAEAASALEFIHEGRGDVAVRAA